MDPILPIFGLIVLSTLFLLTSAMNNRLARIERKLTALLHHHNVDITQGRPVSERVKEIARDPQRKIEAIKVYREETGSSLVEAKDAVEAFMNSL